MSRLYDYQNTGAEWLAERRYAFLGDQMGIGKSAQAIRGADLIDAKRVAVCCPALGRENWKRQFALWSLFRPELLIQSYDTYASNKEARRRLHAFKPDLIIDDEAQCLKSPEAQRTKTMYGEYCTGKGGLVLFAPRVWSLSGTPCPNNAGELWPHFRAMWPHLISMSDRPRSYMEFLDHFTEYFVGDYGLKILGNKNAPELRGQLSKIMLRRRAADVLELPPMIWADPIMLEPTDKALARELKKLETHEDIAEFRRVLEAAANDTTRELYFDEEPIYMATVARLTSTIKAIAVADMLSAELADGAYSKIIVFALHSESIQRMADVLAPFGVVRIEGGMTDRQKQRSQDQFQTDPALRVIVCQQMSAYHTITLTAATQVAFLELAWTPDINVQAARRANRIGSTEPVYVRSFGLVGSIDEAKTVVLSRKSKSTNEILEVQ